MSYIEKEKLIKDDLASIENRVRHAFNQGYDIGYKEGKASKSKNPTGSTTKENLGVREFKEIVVEYPPEDLCTYPEYKGKPYFSIKYKEGNDYFIGYGTYKPQVLSRYLKDYFMTTTTNNLGVDKQIVLDMLSDINSEIDDCGFQYEHWYNYIDNLPSVTPQELRKGMRWIGRFENHEWGKEEWCECPWCHSDSAEAYNFCPNCGADFREVKE